MLRYRDLIGTPKFLPLDQECVPFFTRPSPSRSDGWGLGTRLWGEYRRGWKEVIQRSRAGHNEINRFDHILYIPGTKDKRAHAASLCTIVAVRFCYHRYWPARGIAEKSSLQIVKEQHR